MGRTHVWFCNNDVVFTSRPPHLGYALGRLAQIDAPVTPTIAAACPSKAPRPANSVLDCSKAASFGVTMPEWRDALARFMAARAGE